MKIFDCTTFYSEHLMMDVRFNVLNEHVHKFIVCESTITHSGKPKKLNFEINNYPKFNRVKARKEFTDGFMIKNCENITNSDLKTHLINNCLDVYCVTTTKTSGCKWVQLRTGHHNLGRILTNL